MTPIQVPELIPSGHYSNCVIHQGIAYFSGLLPRLPIGSSEPIPQGIEAQTRQVLSNVERVLKHIHASKQDVLRVTIYLSDIELWGQVNNVYAEFFGEHKPARSIVPVGRFRNGFLLEIDVIAIANTESQA